VAGVLGVVCAAGVVRAENAAAPADKVVKGTGGWLFWESRQKVYAGESELPRKNAEVIVDFNDQLKGAGISLVVVMVPDQVWAAREHWPEAKATFTRKSFTEAFAYAREKGVTVVDASEVVEKMRTAGAKVALTEDAHLSPAAYEAIAKEASGAVGKAVKLKGRPRDFSVASVTTTEPARTAEAGKVESAKVPVTFNVVRHATAQLVAARAGAEVMIMGDSNVIEFCPEGGSLAEHVAKNLAVVPDVRCSAGDKSSDVMRGELARQKDNLEGVKVVVWVMLEGSMVLHGEWKKVEVIKK
jgi:hypothetical protein